MLFGYSFAATQSTVDLVLSSDANLDASPVKHLVFALPTGAEEPLVAEESTATKANSSNMPTAADITPLTTTTSASANADSAIEHKTSNGTATKANNSAPPVEQTRVTTK